MYDNDTPNKRTALSLVWMDDLALDIETIRNKTILSRNPNLTQQTSLWGRGFNFCAVSLNKNVHFKQRCYVFIDKNPKF